MNVQCRVRTLTASDKATSSDKLRLSMLDEHSLSAASSYPEKSTEVFTFDEVIWQDNITQTDVYCRSGQTAVDRMFLGFDNCIFAYGGVGSGKTHTLLGTKSDPGLLFHLIEDVFVRRELLENSSAVERMSIHLSFFDLYDNNVRDLLSHSASFRVPQRVWHHPLRGFCIEGMHPAEPRNSTEAMQLIRNGSAMRVKARSTPQRCHTFFKIAIITVNEKMNTVRTANTWVLDLAANADAVAINCQSLSTLRDVLESLVSRDPILKPSLLTHVLAEALNGNSYVTAIATVSPDPDDYEMTIRTLRFAQSLRALTTDPRQKPPYIDSTEEFQGPGILNGNESASDVELYYRKRLAFLLQQLDLERSERGNESRRVSELEEENRSLVNTISKIIESRGSHTSTRDDTEPRLAPSFVRLPSGSNVPPNFSRTATPVPNTADAVQPAVPSINLELVAAQTKIRELEKQCEELVTELWHSERALEDVVAERNTSIQVVASPTPKPIGLDYSKSSGRRQQRSSVRQQLKPPRTFL